MNKELIKKYKAEFDHWLNGGQILYASYDLDEKNYSAWYELHHDCKWDYNNAYRFKFIINDVYVEFRKALAEGNTIQYYECIYQHEMDVNLDRYDWLDWKSATPSSSFTKTLKYRIKPEEPKFKVGDWVRDKTSKQHTIKKVTSVYSDSVTVVDSTIGINVMLIKDLELWQPKEGELVILKNKNDITSIIKYNGETNVYPFIGEITWLHKKD